MTRNGTITLNRRERDSWKEIQAWTDFANEGGRQETQKFSAMSFSNSHLVSAGYPRATGDARSTSNDVSIGLLGHNSSYVRSKSGGLQSAIISYLSLTDDWDGDGAYEIPQDAIYAALNYLDELAQVDLESPSGVAPSPDGEVVLFWKDESGYAEINFGLGGQLTLCLENSPGNMQLIDENPDEYQTAVEGKVFRAISDYLGKHFPKPSPEELRESISNARGNSTTRTEFILGEIV